MKIEGWTFALGFLFFWAISGAYWYLSRDEVGTTLLALTGALAFLVAFYVLSQVVSKCSSFEKGTFELNISVQLFKAKHCIDDDICWIA